MKKRILFFTLILTSNFLFCQSGKIIYSIKIDSTAYNNPGEHYDRMQKMKEYASAQKFDLCFNGSKSSFKIEELALKKDDFDDFEYDISKHLTTNKDFYVDKSLKKEIQKDLYNNILLESPYNQIDWEIKSDSKKIDSYLCFKAIKLEHFINRKGEKNTREIIAWFAPSLPFGYGPKSYYGLPGLILELQDLNTTFYVSKIELLEKELFIDFPEGKVIDKGEYEKKLKSQLGM